MAIACDCCTYAHAAASYVPVAYSAHLYCLIITNEHEVQSFYGNESHTDHFRLLQRDGDYILVGARNIVFNISTLDLTEDRNTRIVWYSTDGDSSMCFSKGKSESDCQNYIRVLAKKSDEEYLVCGTNAYRPLCRDYSLLSNGSLTFVEGNGIGKCPYDPRHNSTFVFAEGELYSGTVADFQGTTPLVFREPLKTDHNDIKILNAPDFVHSFEHGDHVFFFLRETAVEYMNCGKLVYSRVARVCKKDRGGEPAMYQNLWTTFLKARLNCSVPGEFPFYFDEIQSTSDVVDGLYNGEPHSLVYAIFNTPPNSIPGSAVCVFSMKDIQEAFAGRFKQQETVNSNWLPVPAMKVPEPRPGECVNDSRTLPERNLNFAKTHPLMDEAVPAFYNRPLLVKASFDFKLSKLAVDPQVPLLKSGFVDVLFLATDSGVILKMINALAPHTNEQVESVIIEEIHLFDKPTPVSNLQLAQQTTGDTKLIVITDDAVTAVPLHRCGRATSCSECVGLQDPYCAWFEGAGQCASAHSDLSKPVFQNVTSGVHYLCPKSGENSLDPVDAPSPIAAVPLLGDVSEESTAPPSMCPPCQCEQSSPAPPASPPHKTPSITTRPPLGLPPIGPPGSSGEVEHPATHLIPPLLSPGTNDINEYTISPEGDDPLVRGIAVGGGRGPHGRGLYLSPDGGMRTSYTTDEIGIVLKNGRTLTGPVVGAATTEGAPIYSAETLAIAVTTACVAALVIGFISGFLFSRKCRGDEYSHSYSDTPYLESKLNKCDNLVQSADPNMYSSHTNGKQFNNLVTNYNPKNINGKSNANTTTTDIKPAKCAYI
ncbi:Sema domain [Trinorchestia longiramus]|nr:Sema domain [Trinorchestia longiramus]